MAGHTGCITIGRLNLRCMKTRQSSPGRASYLDRGAIGLIITFALCCGQSRMSHEMQMYNAPSAPACASLAQVKVDISSIGSIELGHLNSTQKMCCSWSGDLDNGAQSTWLGPACAGLVILSSLSERPEASQNGTPLSSPARL